MPRPFSRPLRRAGARLLTRRGLRGAGVPGAVPLGPGERESVRDARAEAVRFARWEPVAEAHGDLSVAVPRRQCRAFSVSDLTGSGAVDRGAHGS
ncbi:hypothetical protein ACH4FA_27535 [Streptomyces sp. NPDC017966]|uniref:hypothetical protein n=1 Tax=Streptomyces sp. NPDC017966 TaxID=3365023 RepID=UPI003799BFA8